MLRFGFPATPHHSTSSPRPSRVVVKDSSFMHMCICFPQKRISLCLPICSVVKTTSADMDWTDVSQCLLTSPVSWGSLPIRRPIFSKAMARWVLAQMTSCISEDRRVIR